MEECVKSQTRGKREDRGKGEKRESKQGGGGEWREGMKERGTFKRLGRLTSGPTPTTNTSIPAEIRKRGR